ncbi:M48 family metallopeptidase [Parabacteroides sp. Marseille-P3160]|uniref:tetratricopeptide repeat protein n=1 Tax=Parabacteroides sp. Marseille-P3160 TaxID=1917887 RepID=UPI0009BBB8C8|nr:tetratricopeptide repeat protein [Parabacteroides sp. Marseille-P3160]
MEEIKQLIYDGRTGEAIKRLDSLIAVDPKADEAYYLRGNAYRKEGDFPRALNNYLIAMDLNPDSPAQHAHDMLLQILNFSDPNRFNH